jgi:disulfide bond formation protein DsbB
VSSTEAVSKAFATLALLLGGLVVLLALLALVGLVFPPARRAVGWVRSALYGSEFWLAFVIALAAVAGSLFFSEHSGFIPCRLCWFQRIAMYPLAIILLVAAVRRDRRGGVWYAIAFPVLGAGTAIYHLYIEAHPEDELAGCKIGAPCSTKWIDVFGFMTIPALALAAFAAIFTLLVLAWPRRGDEDPGDDEDELEDAGSPPGEPLAAGT